MNNSDDEQSEDEHDGKSTTKEEFDDDGNVIQVGNLHFIQGILGQGAFGTVRLARRKLPLSHHSTTQNGKLKHSVSSPVGRRRRGDLEIFVSPVQPDADTTTHRWRSDRHRRRNSADSDLFDGSRSTDRTSTKICGGTMDKAPLPPTTPLPTRTRTPSVVGNLDLFIQPKVSFHMHNDEEELVAVKIFSKSILKRRRTMERDKKSKRVKVKTALQLVEREIALMKKLSHPNIVNLYDVIDSPESDMLYMVLEYMTLGEILTYQNDGTFRRKDPRPGCTKYQVQGIVNGHFTEEQAALYFVDILHGLAYLHLHHICHRDLKPENILLDFRGIAKLGDFGVSHVFKEKTDASVHRQVTLDDSATLSDDESDDEIVNYLDTNPSETHPRDRLTRKDADEALAMKGMSHHGKLTKTVGTWCFWSPAMCEGNRAFSGYAGDMWAAGVCLYIFVTGRLPFYSEVPTELFEKIRTAEANYRDYGLSNSLVDLLHKCLEKESDKRAGVGDCLKHPALQVARSKRVKQLCAEFELSRKHKITLTEDDVRTAFRMVTKVPKEIIRSASKTIHHGAKKLHEGLSEARDRLSHHGRSTPSADVGHREGFFRPKMGSFASSVHSSSESGREHHRVGFFHRYNSHDSSINSKVDIDEHASDAVTVDSVVTMRKDGLTCTLSSFGSAGSDDDPQDIVRENGGVKDYDDIHGRSNNVRGPSASFSSSVDVKDGASAASKANLRERKVSFHFPDEPPNDGTPMPEKTKQKKGKCLVM